ncbi:SPOR domain-containing protein [Psychromonas sp. Urea-02u-13]|uniref:SPOR domain-containing protein n=1 Tax=Psychromonas sp. Urea-02u-13 TaxID=2058326 RepID=UPI000C32ABA4|nr:SPOR domain-containing protein [Psychromonas sp. Urea-02u-13]PKG37799.1 hypothetical protein CXF74_16975 [Psychromonas sp. Urea-02u-13]
MIKYRFLLILFSLFFICSISVQSASVPEKDNSLSVSAITMKLLLSNPQILSNISNINKANKEQRIKHYASESSGIPNGEELILSIYIKRGVYGKTYIADIFAEKSQANAKLSLTSLFETFDFPIEVDVEEERVKGWFLNEKNNFELVFPRQEDEAIKVLVNEVESHLTKDNYFIIGGDIFVEAEVVAQWFNVDFDFNFSDLELLVSSEEKLPIEVRNDRKMREVGGGLQSVAVHPWKKSQYQIISAPLFDVQLNSSVKEDDIYGSYSLLSVQDLAYLSSSFYAYGNSNDKLSDARLTFSKEDKEANLLGPLRATKYELGDVTAVKTANSRTSGYSRGVRFSNAKSSLAGNNRTTTITGEVQAGWDAELYRNGLFVDKQINIRNGRYDFRDIRLYIGNNNFEIILYGRQGQVIKETQPIYIAGNALSLKEVSYDISVTQLNETLLGISDRSLFDEEGWEAANSLSMGLSDNVSLTLGSAYIFNDIGDDEYTYSVGTSITPFDNLVLTADYQDSKIKDQRLVLSARTLFDQHSLLFSYTRLSIEGTNNSDIGSETYNLTMNGQIGVNLSSPISYENIWFHSIPEEGEINYGLSNQLSFRSNQFSLSNLLSWKHSGANQVNNNYDYDYDDDDAFGSFEVARNFSSIYTRLITGYELHPEARWQLVEGSVDFPITNRMGGQSKVSYSPINDRLYTTFGLNWNLDAVRLNSSVYYDNDDDWYWSVNAAFGFGYEPTTDEFFIENGSMARKGTLLARVFEDDNLNGQYDEGENLLEGVKVKAVQGYRQENTNEDGIAVLTNLPDGKRTDIIIDPKTVEDPFMIPATPGVSITGRKGFIDVLDIPMVNAGELDGTVYLKDKRGNDIAGAYLNIHLHNEKGDLVASTETEFDGYYLFTDLVPGKYTASIDIEDIKRKNLHDAKVLEFEFSAAGDVIAGADFVIQRYTFVKGYTVDLGEFHSLILLKAFWQIIKPNYNNALQQQVFYSENSEEGLFRINAAFFKDKTQADRACQYLQKQDINCAVKEFEFNL